MLLPGEKKDNFIQYDWLPGADRHDVRGREGAEPAEDRELDQEEEDRVDK